jgi:hypothetical protein
MKNTIFKTSISLILTAILLSFQISSNTLKNSPLDSTTLLANCNHYLDGQISDLNTINNIGESGIAYCITPPNDAENAFWFTTEEALTSWLIDKPYKDDLTSAIQDMNTKGEEACTECSISANNTKVRKPTLSGVVWGNAWQNANGTGTSNAYFFWHKTLHSFNNQASLVGVTGPLATNFAAWCTDKKFKGSRLVQFVVLGVIGGRNRDLTGTIFNDNIESVY